jgi:NADH dehydrogenase
MPQAGLLRMVVADPPGHHGRMSATPQVLVVGATGALGRPVVRLLRERGVSVRALSRHPARADDLAALGAEVVVGDLTDAASLQRACTGVQRVLAAAHGLLGRGRWRSEAVDDAGHRALFTAAQHSGVQRLVYTSAYAATADHPVDFFRTKHAMEQALAATGLPHVILRPTAFMEQHVHLFNGKGLLDKGRAQLIGPGTKPRNFVAASDVAQFAVRALLDDPAPFQALSIGGHGHHSNAEVAALYAREAGVPARISRLPVPLARIIATLAAPLHPGMARVLRLSSLPDGAYSERFDGADALEREHGIRLTRLEEFVAARVAGWRAGSGGAPR